MAQKEKGGISVRLISPGGGKIEKISVDRYALDRYKGQTMIHLWPGDGSKVTLLPGLNPVWITEPDDTE